MSYSRSFSKHSNQLMSANDYINKKKAQTLFKVLTTNAQAFESTKNIKKQPIKTVNNLQQQSQKLLSVGGFNVLSYDLLLNFSKGSYYISPEGRTIEIPIYTTNPNPNSTTEVSINDCTKTTIKRTNSVNQPLTQSWNIYEGSYIVNKTNTQSACLNTLRNTPNITISNELINSLVGRTALANLNLIDSLKDFYYPKNLCF
jgi:ribosomal protein S8E